MFLSSWRKLAQQVRRISNKSRRGKRQAAEAQKSRWLFFEQLEDRTLLSSNVFVWTDLGGDNAWTNGANWASTAGGYPQNPGDVAQFTGVYTGAQTTIGLAAFSPLTVGEIDFNTSSSITIQQNFGSSAGTVSNLTLAGAGAANAVINTLPTNSGVDSFTVGLNATNPLTTNLSGGTVVLGSANSFASGSAFTVNNGGSLLITTVGGTGPNGGPYANIVANTGGNVTFNGTINGVANWGPIGNVTLGGGNFSVVGAGNSSGSNVSSTLTVGTITLNPGSSTITTTPGPSINASSSASIQLTATNLIRNTGATVEFIGNNTATAPTPSNALGTIFNEITFTSPGAALQPQGDNGGILPYSSTPYEFPVGGAIASTGFATYASVTGSNPSVSSIQPFTGYVYSSRTPPSSWQTGDTIAMNVSNVLSGSTTINAIVFEGSVTNPANDPASDATGAVSLGEAGYNLTIASGNSTAGGAILESATSEGGYLNGGTLQFGTTGTGEGIINTNALPFGPGVTENLIDMLRTNQALDYYTNAQLYQYELTLPVNAARIDPDIAAASLGAGGLVGPALASENFGTVGEPGTGQENSFANNFSGYINIVTAGTYTFGAFSDDNSLIYIDGHYVTQSLYNGSSTSTQGSIYLTAGLHTFVDKFEQGGGGSAVLAYYSGPDNHYAPIGPANAATALITSATVSYNQYGVPTFGPGLLTAGPVFMQISSGINTNTTALTVGGSGTLELPLANGFSGQVYMGGAIQDVQGIQVASGTLVVGSNTSLGSGTINFVGGTLESSAEVTLNNPMVLNSSAMIIGGTNQITLTNNATLTGNNSLIDNDLALVTIPGGWTGSGSLAITGTGNVVLSGANTYTGGTSIASGTVAIATTSAGPANSPTSGPFGTGPLTISGTSSITSDATARTLLNPISVSGNLTLSGSSYNSTNTGSSSTSGLTLAGAVTLTGNTTITVNTGGVGVAITGNISGGSTSQLTLAGLGSLTLAGNDSYGSLAAGGTVLNMGTYGAEGTVILSGGNANNAFGVGTLTINGGTIQNNSGGSVTLSNALNFSSASGGTSGNSYLTLTGSPFIFSGGVGSSISGTANLVVNATTTISEALSDGTATGNLVLFSGSSQLILQGAEKYSGSTVVNSGTLVLSGNGTLQSSGIYVNVGGTFIEDNTATNNFSASPGFAGAHNGRLLGIVYGLNLDGGTYELIANAAGTLENLETGTGGIVLGAGNSTILTSSANGGAVTIDAGSLQRFAGATVNFLTVGSEILGGPTGIAPNQIIFGQASPFVPLQSGVNAGVINNILPYATVQDGSAYNGGFNLASTFSGFSGDVAIRALPSASYTAQTSTPFTSSENVLVTSSLALSANTSVNSLLIIGDGISVTGAADSLAVGSGAIATYDATNSAGDALSMSGGLPFPSGTEAIFLTNKGQLTVNSVITGNDGLTISGPGGLVLPNANNYNNSSQPNNADVQQIYITNALDIKSTGGTFTLSFGGLTTTSISWVPLSALGGASATATNIQTALQALSNIGAGGVTVVGDPTPVGSGNDQVFTVTFTGALTGSDQPLITAPVTGNVLGGAANTTGFTDLTAGLLEPVISTQLVVAGQSATNFNSGTLTLGTNNALSQGLTVVSGTLQGTNPVVLPNGVDFGAGATLSTAANGGGSASSAITLGGNVLFSRNVETYGLSTVLNVTSAVLPTIVSGIVIPGALGAPSGAATTNLTSPTIIKQGAGTLTLTGADTYLGNTIINQGILNVQNNAALGQITNTVQTLQIQNPGSATNSTFELVLNGNITTPITFSTASATLITNITNALNSLPNVAGLSIGVPFVSVSVITDTATLLYANITFLARLGNEPQLTVAAPTNFPGATFNDFVAVTGVEAANVTVSSGATLQLQGGDSHGQTGQSNSATDLQALGLTLGQTFDLNGAGVVLNGTNVGAVQNLTGYNTLNNSIVLGLGASPTGGVTVGGDVYGLTLDGPISGGEDLTKVGTDNLFLPETNTSLSTNIAAEESGIPGYDVNTYTGESFADAGFFEIGDNTIGPNGPTGSNLGGIQVANGATLLFMGYGVNSNGASALVGLGNFTQQITVTGTGFGTLTTQEAGPPGTSSTAVGGQAVNTTQDQASGAILNENGETIAGNIYLAGNTTINDAFNNNYNADSVPHNPMVITGIISGSGSVTLVGGGDVWYGNAMTYTGGTYVQQIQLDLYGSGAMPAGSTNAQDAVQTITFGGTITTGSTFTLSFNGATTGAITYLTTGGFTTLQNSILNALGGLSTVPAGGVSVQYVTSSNPPAFTVTFQNGLADTIVPTILSTSSLTGTNPSISVATTQNGVSQVAVGIDATLQIDDQLFQNPNHLSASTNITLYGGIITFLGFTANGGQLSGLSGSAGGVADPLVQQLGNLTLATGASIINVQPGDSPFSTSVITSSGLLRLPGATLFLNSINDLTVASLQNVSGPTPLSTITPTSLAPIPVNPPSFGPANQVFFGNSPPLINGILPFVATTQLANILQATQPSPATYDWATYDSQQTVNLGGVIAGGTFTLAFTPPTGSAVTTAPITYSPTTSVMLNNIQSALNNALGANNTTVNGGATPTSFVVTFQNALVGVSQSTLVPNYANLQDGSESSNPPVITVTPAAAPFMARFTNYVTNLASAVGNPTANVELTGNASLTQNLTVNSLIISGANTLSIGSGNTAYNLNLTSGGVMATTNSTATISGGTLNLGSGEGILMGNTNIIITSVIAGAGGLTLSDTGTLTLGSNGGLGNTYAGITTIDIGNVLVDSASSLSSGAVNFTFGAISTALTFGGSSANQPPTGSFAIPNNFNFNNSVVNLGYNVTTYFVGNFNLTGTNQFTSGNFAVIAGTISGTGSLDWTGGNSAIESALNTYSGGTILGSSGSTNQELQLLGSSVLNAAGQLLSGPLGVGTVNIQGSGEGNVGGNDIFASANTTASTLGGDQLTSAFDNQLLSTVTIYNPILMINGYGRLSAGNAGGGGNEVFAGPMTIEGTAELDCGPNQELAITGQISGSGAIVDFAGNGSTAGFTSDVYLDPTTNGQEGGPALPGGNTFTGGVMLNHIQYNGATTISTSDFGALSINEGSALGTGVLTWAGGTLADDGNDNGQNGNPNGITITNPIELDPIEFHEAQVFGSSITLTGVITGSANTSLSQGLNNPANILAKIGPGNLVLTQPELYTEATLVNYGPLTLSGGGALVNTSGITVNPGATLTLDNSAVGTNNANRIADAIPITLSGGTLNLIGNNAAGIATSETLGAITVNGGESTISAQIGTAGTAAGDTTALNIGTITRTLGGLLTFAGINAPLSVGGANEINVTGTALGLFAAILNDQTELGSVTTGLSASPIGPAVVTGPLGTAYMLPWSTVESFTTPAAYAALTPSTTDFASVTGPNVAPTNNQGPYSVSAFTDYTLDNGGANNLGSNGGNNPTLVFNVSVNDPNVTASNDVAAILISGNNVTIGPGANTLTLGQLGVSGAVIAGPTGNGQGGAILVTGQNDTLSSSLSMHGSEGFLVTGPSASLNITGNIGTTGIAVGSNTATNPATTNGLTIGGLGTLTFNSNSYANATTFIDGGTLVLANSASLGTNTGTGVLASNPVICYTAALQSGATSAAGVIISNPIALNGGPGYFNTAVFFLTNDHGINPLTLSPVTYGALTVNGTGSNTNPLQLTGIISGNAGITVSGAATLYLAGATSNTFAGTMMVNSGATLDLAMTFGNAGAGSIVINGGTVNETTNVSQYNSGASQNIGVFIIGNANGAYATQGGPATNGTLNLNANPLSVGFLFFENGGTANLGTGTLSLLGNINTFANSPSTAFVTGGNLVLTNSNGETCDLYTQASGAASDLTISSIITAPAQAFQWICKIGTGTLTLANSVANGVLGAVCVNQGTLVLAMTGTANAYGGSLFVNGFAGPDQLKVTTNFAQMAAGYVAVEGVGATLDISGSTAVQTVGSLDIRGGTIRTGNNTLAVSGSITGLPSAGETGTIVGNLALPATDIFASEDASGVPGLDILATISGSGGITKQGTGTVELSNTLPNTFQGFTTVNEGTLLLSGGTSATSQITFSGNITGGSFTLAYNSAAASPSSGTTPPITWTTIPAALQISIQDALNSLPGLLGNTVVTIPSLGSSSLNSTFLVTFQGGLAVTAATSSVGSDNLTTSSGSPTINVTNASVTASTNALGVGQLTIGDSAGGSGTTKADVVRLSGSNEIASTGSGAGVVTISNSGLLDLNSFNQTINSLTMSGGTLNTETGTLALGGNIAGTTNASNATPAVINGNLALQSSSANGGTTLVTITVGSGSLPATTTNLSGSDMIINAKIVNNFQSGTITGGINKAGTGLLQLTGNNTYSGATNVNAGVLQVDGTQTASVITVNGGGTKGSAVLSGTGTLGNVVATAGGEVNPGDPAAAVGTLNMASLNLSVSGILEIEIPSPSSYDVVNLTGVSGGPLTLDGSSQLTLDLLGLTTDVDPVLAGDGGIPGVAVITNIGSKPGAQTFNTSSVPSNVTTINNSLGFQPVATDPSFPAKMVVSVTAPGTHFVYNNAATAGAGSSFPFTLAAEDQFNNTALGYNGTVRFTSSDTGFSGLPSVSGYSMSGGIGVFNATLTTAGSQTITAIDVNNSTITGSAAVAVVAGAPVNYNFNYPSPVAAGNNSVFTITAVDQYNNPATSFTGTVKFSSSDTAAILPGVSTVTSGVGLFASDLKTVGTQSITATSSTFSGTDSSIVVKFGSVTHLGISSPTATSGLQFNVTVAAEDAFNNTVTTYTGTVSLSSSDSAAAYLPQTGALVNGTGTFGVTLFAAGIQTITATDIHTPSLVGTGQVTVTANGVNHFAVIPFSNSVSAGSPIVFEVIAEDQNNNTSPYSGTVAFNSSDTLAFATGGVQATGSLTNGIGYFGATLKTAGTQTISVMQGSATGTTTPGITVFGLSATRFVIVSAALSTYGGVSSAYPSQASPASSFANTGTPIFFTVLAEDQFNNVYKNYGGTVAFTSSDTALSPGHGLPTNATLTNGSGLFSATLLTPGNQVVTATEIGNASITGNTGVVVTRGLVLTSLAVTPSGFTVSFNKAFNPSVVNLYTTGAVPDDVLLTTSGAVVSVRGSLVFNSTDTSFTFVKTATPTATGAFNPTNGLLAAGKYTLTLRSFNGSSGFEDSLGGLLDGADAGLPGNNYQITFTVATPPVSVGIPDFARGPSNTDAIFISTSVTNGSTFALSYTNPTTLTTGTATVTFSTIAATLQNNIQSALNGMTQVGSTSGTPNSVVVATNDTVTGANVLVTFQNGLATATSQLLTTTTAGITIAAATLNVPNNVPGIGIPIALSSGLNVTSGTFVLQYNPTLLNITGVVTRLTAAGATFSVVTNSVVGTSGTLTLSLSSTSPLSATTNAITLGSLVATVPLSATSTYGAKQLLHFSSEQLNGGNITVTNVDGVQVVAYLGDVTDKGGPFTLGDAGAIAAVSGEVTNTTAQTIPGFTAFPNLDPVIIGDVSLQGSVNSTDAGTMNQEVGGTARVTIPYAPIGLSVVAVGPDPALSVPTDLVAAVGQTVQVPVNIDTAHPDGSNGIMDAVLALSYDPQVFSVSASDVQLGALPEGSSGWKLETQVNQQTGQIGIELYSDTPITNTAAGSLVTISMHVLGNAPAGTTALNIVPFVDPSGGMRAYVTQLSDSAEAYVLHPALTSSGLEPGSAGEITIVGQAPALETATYLASDEAQVSRTLEVSSQPSSSGASTGNTGVLPAALLEQVFGSMEPGMQVAQPGAILSTEPQEQDSRAQALSQGIGQGDWLSEDYLSYLGKTAHKSVRKSELLDGVSDDMDGEEMAGLEAYFAREGGNSGH